MNMTNAIKVDPSGKTITINSLMVGNADFFSVVSSQPETKRDQVVLDVIGVGSAAMRRVQTTVDVDLVEKRFAELSTNFERTLSRFERQTNQELEKHLSPTESGSYTKYIADLVSAARRDCQGWSADLGKAAKELLDPDRKNSAVGRLEEIIEQAAAKFEEMFDPNLKGSYSSRLNEQLSSVFGTGGRAGTLQGALNDALRPVLAELREVKERIEARKAAERVIASSSLKGRPFEELVQARLSQLGQPFGDDVLAVGNGNGGTRAGDFLVSLNGSGRRIVVEARDRRQISLPAIKAELDREIGEREADFAIYVSSGVDMLPQHVGDFQVYGDKVVTTLPNLHIGYRLARLLALSEAPKGEVDLPALRSVLGKIKDSARSLRDVKAKASQVKKLADGIHSDVEGAESGIIELLAQAEQLLSCA